PETKNSVAQLMKKSLESTGNIGTINIKIVIIANIEANTVFINFIAFILNINIPTDKTIPIREDRADTSADIKITTSIK
ncbi:hypothetical protein, partial [Enterobacter hormaechei]|uniref:hypothetical protein n=1 Tax=Enterobacter hormaechei TaxID=158836 RepID=UPI001953FB21